MSDERLYSVKMRASSAGVHVSGAEKIVSAESVSKVASRLVERALAHPKGTPDFVNVKVEAQPPDIVRLKALPVRTHVVETPDEGRALVARLLAEAGIVRADEIMARFSEAHSLRGAMLLDSDTLHVSSTVSFQASRSACRPYGANVADLPKPR